MPPVRWKCVYVSLLTLLLVLIGTHGQLMQESISMSSDGWRPIIGTRRQPPGFPTDVKSKEITEYKNPTKTEVDIVKAEVLESSSTATPRKLPTKISSIVSTNNINGGSTHKPGEKVPPHTKFTSPGPYHTLPASVHGPPIPINGTVNKTAKFGHIKKRPVTKPSTPSYFGPKRKPVRGQMISHSTRNEVFVRPPASFPFVKQGSGNIKTRETQGLGVLGSNHFVVNQQSTHPDFSNRFALPSNEESFQNAKNHPITYIFSNANDVQYKFKSQNDEYTRNLVPPPPLPVFQQDTDKIKPIKLNKFSENVVSSTEPIIKLTDFGSNVQFVRNPQENLQLPSPFEQNFQFQKQFNKPNKEPTIDVQVTKEKLKEFYGSQPVNYNSNGPDYLDYDFHSLKKPEQLPKLQTYEVTEGKWIDNPNPFTFSVTKSEPVVAQPLRQLPSSAKPHLFTVTPIVELNVPPFLPTPYRPPTAVPTSPTQSEAATVFSQVSTKMNRYKNEALTNPFFFDVKEVSTHYPILGKPEIKPDSPTSRPLPMGMNSEISNDITTTTPATIRPTKSRRRRPRPRKPSTSTTTTEEPALTENYNLQKIEETSEEMSMETERPVRRRPSRPNRHRTNSVEERPTRYRTTTPMSEEDTTEKLVRTRHRFRQRGSSTKSENRNASIRRRIRPTSTDMPSNHKETELDTPHQSNESAEPFIEQVQSSEKETQGLFETKYLQENVQSSNMKTNKVKYESPNRNFDPTQYEEESKYATTVINNDLNSIGKPMYEESNEEESERVQVYDKTRPSVSETIEQETTANIHPPENEIDYTTLSPSSEQLDERMETTIASTIPTTTMAETTTKLHRIRGRPLKTRPRFSVKDYRQRLNQYTSTTPSTTTDIFKTTSEGATRLRFPSRLRTRPTLKTSSTQTYNPDDEGQLEPIRRGGFKPKEPRHSTTTEGSQINIITEKNAKSVNTKLRPFGRFKSTTEASPSLQKVSIKPNLFSVRRRPPQLNLRNRIYKNKNGSDEPTTVESETESTDSTTVPTTEMDFNNNSTESSTRMKMETTSEFGESTTNNINEDDYIQRVSDLTSSFKNQYETPGLFKSVSPNSRRIPNYFTISTDDPILPIEAFFPNIKDKEQ